MNKLHICLRPKGDANWIGGVLYIENLTKAIQAYAAESGEPIRVTVGTSKWDRIGHRLSKELASRASFLPPSTFNARGFDFVYPELAGARAPFRWGAWIPDFQEDYLPQFFTADDIKYRHAMYEQMVQHAPIVVLSSQMAQKDLARIYRRGPDRSAVLRFTSFPDPEWLRGDPIAVQAEYGLPDRFYIVCNQFWKHKDHGTILDALARLKDDGIRPVVACTGNTVDYRNPDYFPSLEKRIADLDLGDQVRILGLIPRKDQIQLIRRSLAVIQPSLFEGWSTVVEDSRALAKVMLLSDFPVHREQDPPGARFFPCGDGVKLAELMARGLQDLFPGPDPDAEREAYRVVGERTLEFGRTFVQIARSVQ